MSGSIRAYLVENGINVNQILRFSIHPAERESHGWAQIVAHLIYIEAARSSQALTADVSHTDGRNPAFFDKGVMSVAQGCIRDGLVRQIHASCYVPQDPRGDWIYFVIAGVPAS